MSDTPRTDAVMDAKYDSPADLCEALLDHARDLERENAYLMDTLRAQSLNGRAAAEIPKHFLCK